MHAFSSLLDSEATLPGVAGYEHVATLVLGGLLGFLVALWVGSGRNTNVTELSHSYLCRGFALLMRGIRLLKDVTLASIWWSPPPRMRSWAESSSAGSTATVPERSLTASSSSDKTRADWYGTERDVEIFLSRIGEDNGRWKCICQNTLGGYLKYEAYCRILPGGKTEYKSVTLVKDATAEEMTEFYLDDQCRCQWDSMLAHTEQLESGSVRDRCEVVRWIRHFPFPFLTDREYVIGRRIFRKDDIIYTVSRGIEHAAAPIQDSLVRMDVFYSMWSCRDIVCPWGTDQRACEVVLLHHEQFKIPEKLARFAACKGMWGFIKSMGPAVASYIQTQRASAFRSSRFSHSNSEISVTTSEGSSSSMERNGKPNKLMRTAKRALIATLVTVILIKRSQAAHSTTTSAHAPTKTNGSKQN